MVSQLSLRQGCYGISELRRLFYHRQLPCHDFKRGILLLLGLSTKAPPCNWKDLEGKGLYRLLLQVDFLSSITGAEQCAQ